MQHKVVQVLDAVEIATREREVHLYAFVPLSGGSLHTSTADCTVCTNVFEVDGRCYYFDVVQRELRTLSDDFAVNDDESTAVVVEAIAVATLLVRVEIDASELEVVSEQ